jgi:protein-S-isoprenylcysteine O-methyltransferase Ste14
VIVRTGLRLLGMMAAIALLIFLPAGAVRYWQAWVYLAAFGGSTLGITAYLARFDRALLARRLEAGPIAEHESRHKLPSALAGLGFMALFVIAGLDRRFHWSSVSPIASLVADAAVLAGFAIVFLTFRANSYTSATIAVAKEQPLVDHGPYAVVRHPMYAGALLMLLATPIALGSWWASSGVLLMVLAIVARLLGEERYLAAHLAGYADYRRRVRYRLIPYVW